MNPNRNRNRNRNNAAGATPTTFPPALISVVDHYLPDDTHNLYDITFDSHTIRTLLTSDPSFVETWIAETLQSNSASPSPSPSPSLLVGLDVEWRPNFQRNVENLVATLQLCVGNRCLVFQIIHSPSVPISLAAFLADPNNTFVGVGIEEDAEKLLLDYSLGVANTVDLRTLAANKMGDPALKNTGIKTLTQHVLGRDVQKPRKVTMSKWDNLWLTAPQVQYATLDAFLASQIGLTLLQN